MFTEPFELVEPLAEFTEEELSFCEFCELLAFAEEVELFELTEFPPFVLLFESVEFPEFEVSFASCLLVSLFFEESSTLISSLETEPFEVSKFLPKK